MGTQQLTKGQNVPLDPEVKGLRMSVRWTSLAGPADVDLVALLIGQDRRVRSDADMVFYNQTSTADGSVVHAGKVAGDAGGSDDVSVDLTLITDDVHGLTIAASTDGIEFGALEQLDWCIFLESGELAAQYRVGGLSTERALVLGELYRRDGLWRLRAVGQGWAGGLEGLATDYGVSVASDDTDSVQVEPAFAEEEAPKRPTPATKDADSRTGPVDSDPVAPEREPAEMIGVPVSAPDGKASPTKGSGVVATANRSPEVAKVLERSATRRVRVGTGSIKPVDVPRFHLADDQSWTPSRLFSISGIGGVDEQEKRSTSALLWTMAAVRPLGRALTARAAAPAGALETFLEVQFPLGEQRVIPDGVIRIARGGRVWTALVEVKTGDASLQRDQLESYLRLAKRRKYDVVWTISNEISTYPGIHPVDLPGHLTNSVALVHISWSEVMHEIRMLLSHHQFTEALPMWILSELLRYLEHPRSGAMAFHDMGPNWVPVREAVATGTLRSADRHTAPVVNAWHRLVRQLCLGLTARLGVPVKQTMPRRLLSDPGLRVDEAAHQLADTGVFSAVLKVPDAAGPIFIAADLRTCKVTVSMEVVAPQEGSLQRRMSWLTRQLKDAPADLLVEARFAPRVDTTCERLGDIRERPAAMIPHREWEPSSFLVSRGQPIGTKRSGAHGSFVVSVTRAVDEFYAEVVECLRPWTPPAPPLPPPISDAGADAAMGSPDANDFDSALLSE